MPLFVFASGYTSTGLRNNIHDWHDVNLYIRKLALRIGLPNLLWTTLAMAVGYSFSHRWDRLGIVLIVTLFILCLALFLFYSNEKRWGGDNRIWNYSSFICYNPFMVSTIHHGNNACFRNNTLYML